MTSKRDRKALPELLAATLIWLTASFPAHAGGLETSSEPFGPIDAQALIDACWEMTYEQRLGSTADMREGILLSALCLEKHILDQFEALFDPDVLSREEASKELRAIRMTYGGLAWKLYNSHKDCYRSPCGTLYHTFHVSEVADFMEQLLRKAVDQRNEYGL